MTVTPDDLIAAADLCRETFVPAVDMDWSVPAADIDQTCRETIDHVVSTQVFYASHLAGRATARLPRLRKHDPDAPVADVLDLVPRAAAVLAMVVRGSAPDVRAFHPAGMADPEGFLAMGCDEIIVHTRDITAGLDLAFAPPDDLCARLVARLFPWAPADTDPWPTLLWANGRAPLGDLERLEPDWNWHCAPLAEWDGEVSRRIKPAAWSP
jgi:hypothetical protein